MTRYLCLALSVLVFARGTPADQQASPPVRIGAIQSLTGIAAEYGKTLRQSLTMAVDDINGPGGARVQLVLEDDGTLPRNTVTAFQRLQSSGVDAIIGASWDFTTNAILPLAAKNKLVVFNTSTIKESIALDEAGGYGFASAFLADEEAQPLDRFLTTHPARSSVIIYANNAWGEIQLESYSAVLKRRGVKILEEIRPSGYETNDWAAVVPRLKALSPDLLLLLLNKDDLYLLMRRLREVHLSGAVFSSTNGFDALRTAPDGSILEGLCFSYPLEQLSASSDFVSRYRNRFGEAPRIYADITYDAVFLLVEAVKIAREKGLELKEALQQTEFKGIAGLYRYSPARSFCVARASLVCIHGGEARLLE